LLRPGKICEYTLDLWHTGTTIPAGSRLQIAVASAVFLLFSRNLNTGGHNETETRYIAAKQAIYHDAKHPSHILFAQDCGIRATGAGVDCWRGAAEAAASQWPADRSLAGAYLPIQAPKWSHGGSFTT
jgi:hypothetical protein